MYVLTLSYSLYAGAGAGVGDLVDVWWTDADVKQLKLAEGSLVVILSPWYQFPALSDVIASLGDDGELNGGAVMRPVLQSLALAPDEPSGASSVGGAPGLPSARPVIICQLCTHAIS